MRSGGPSRSSRAAATRPRSSDAPSSRTPPTALGAASWRRRSSRAAEGSRPTWPGRPATGRRSPGCWLCATPEPRPAAAAGGGRRPDNEPPGPRPACAARRLEDERNDLQTERASFNKIKARKQITLTGEWDDLDPYAKREVIQAVIEAVVIRPTGRTGLYNPSRVDVIPLQSR